MTKVLLIEDDAVLRENVTSILSFEGFEVETAADGVEGVEVAKQYTPDLIICDIMMPRLDGYGVLKQLQTDEKLSTIPFLFLTARSERQDMRQGMELGANDYLTKPFTRAELLRAITSLIEKHQRVTNQYQQKVDQLQKSMTLSLPHEFRTPLSIIMGYTSYLLENISDISIEELEPALADVYQSSLRLQRLIENHVLYAQLQGNVVEAASIRSAAKYLQANPIDTHQYIKDITERVAQQHKRLHDLKVTTSPSLLSMMPDYFSKIVEELVDNAFKFSTTGSPVEVYSHSNNNSLHISIIDQGEGMEDTNVKTIDGFVQFDRDIHEQQGMGLGLYIAQRLVRLHQGQMKIESVLGQGTQISILLPLEIK